MEKCKFFFAVVSASGGTAFNHGFHVALPNLLYTVVLTWYTDLVTQRNWNITGFYHFSVMMPFIVACFPLGAIIGSALIWICATLLGRKLTILCNNGLILLGLFVISFAYLGESFEVFIVGRFILGIAAGLGSGITPMYLVEISPDCLRGIAGSFYYVMVAGSILLAYVLCIPQVLGNEKSFSFLFVVCILPSCIQMMTLVLCPESPKHYMFDEEDEDSAEEATAWLQGDDVHAEIEDLREEGALLKEIGPVTFERLVEDQIFRSPLIIATVILFGQQICGMDAILCFSNVIFLEMGISFKEAYLYTIGLGICNFVMSILSMFLVDSIGRKPLLMGSFGGMAACTIILTMVSLMTRYATQKIDAVDYIALVCIYLYVASFALGAGTIPWFYAAEICNHFARPLTMTIAVTLNWILHFVIAMTFLLFKAATGSYTLLPYLIFDVVVIIFLALTMRETMHMPAVDITELFYD